VNSSIKLTAIIQQANGSHGLSPEQAAALLHLNIIDNFVVTSWEDTNKLKITFTRLINFIYSS
jgi:hypothetical protein